MRWATLEAKTFSSVPAGALVNKFGARERETCPAPRSCVLGSKNPDVEKRATLTLQEGYRRPSLSPPSGCENSFSSCNEGKATRDNLHRKEGMDRLRELVQLRLLPNCRSVPQGRAKLDADRGSQLNAD